MESALADVWIDETLKAHAALVAIVPAVRIFEDIAPENTVMPYIVWQNQDPPRDIRGVGTTRVMTVTDYIVKGIAEVAQNRLLKDIAREIDVALHGKLHQAITGGGTMNDCVREQEFRLREERDGRQIRHLGGVYRLHIQS